MKKIINLVLVTFVTLMFIACGSTAVETEPDKQEVPTPSVETPVEEEVEPVKEQPKYDNMDEKEFERSIKGLTNGETLSIDEVAADKAEIFKIIDELKVIMANEDFNAWLEYVAPESREFYSHPRKIKQGTSVVIYEGLNDYFKRVFIPSRKESTVKELRYDSDKAVRVLGLYEAKGKKVLRTYYNFQKIDDKWFVILPTEFVVD